jgi:hypothetical protein
METSHSNPEGEEKNLPMRILNLSSLFQDQTHP